MQVGKSDETASTDRRFFLNGFIHRLLFYSKDDTSTSRISDEEVWPAVLILSLLATVLESRQRARGSLLLIGMSKGHLIPFIGIPGQNSFDFPKK